MKIGIINSNVLHRSGSGYRIDPDIHLSDGVQAREQLAHSPYELSTVGENASQVFLGNIFSRVFVKDKEHGMPYLAASDTVLANIETGRFLSNKQARILKNLILKKDWILITCSGTLGNVTYTNKTFENHIATHDLIRVVPNDNKVNKGTLYAFLSGTYGYNQITQSQFGGVVKHINDVQTKAILVPVFPESFQQEVDGLIQESARLREEAADMLEKSKNLLKEKAGLDNLVSEDYDYYGHRSADRKVSCFSIKQKEITTTTINAFNYSRRILNTKSKIQSTVPLKEVLLYNDVFSTGSFPRVEVSGNNGIMLINQSDIFDAIIKGKRISKRRVKTDNLVEYGEVLIAGVGTLGDSEKFCHVIFANEDLVGQLVSGEFIRMKTTKEVTSGYLFAWLDTDYGFRLIRNTQAGTKLCRPIPRMLLEIPVPLIDSDSMQEIDRLVREAHTKRYQANCNERKAISMVEKEIESWTTSKKN